MNNIDNVKMDEGWSWLVLVGVFFTNTLTFGFMQCLGVFFVDWQQDLGVSAQAVGWSSSVFIAGFGVSGLISSLISSHVSCRLQGFLGGAIAAASLASSYWITYLGHLYILMGISGFGTGLSFTSSTVVLAFYFKKKLALANGIGSSGSGIGLIILAPLIRNLNDEYSWRGALTICGAVLAHICVFTALFRMSKSERLSMTNLRTSTKIYAEIPPETDGQSKSRPGNDTENRDDTSTNEPVKESNLSLRLRIQVYFTVLAWTYKSAISIRFIMMCVVAVLLSGFGYMSAIMYFVSNAIQIGISKSDAAFLLSIFGICSGISRLIFGPIIDKNFMLPSQIGSVVLAIGGLTCLIGSLARTYTALVIFAVILGLSTPLYNILQFLILKDVVGIVCYKNIFGTNVVLWNTAGLVSLPILGHIYDSTGNYSISFYIAGSVMLLNSIVNILDPVWRTLSMKF